MVNKSLINLFDVPDSGVGFHQGTIQTWNSATGENTILVAGGTLTNVSILNTGEAIALKAGHTVGLLTFNGSWFILGRITKPTDPDFASASVAFANNHNSATNFSVTTAHLNKASTTITVPDWVDEALIMMTAEVSLANTDAVNGYYASIEPFIDGVGGGGIGFGLSPNAHASFNDLNGGSTSWSRLIVNPAASIPISIQAWVTAGTLPASATSTAVIDVIGIFRSTT